MTLRLIGAIGGLTSQPSPDFLPVATLIQWRLLRPSSGAVHLIGYCLEHNEGRVSSSVLSVDATSRQCVTKSGRVYRVLGPSGHDRHGDWVWKQVMNCTGLTVESDLTADLEADFVNSERE